MEDQHDGSDGDYDPDHNAPAVRTLGSKRGPVLGQSSDNGGKRARGPSGLPVMLEDGRESGGIRQFHGRYAENALPAAVGHLESRELVEVKDGLGNKENSLGQLAGKVRSLNQAYQHARDAAKLKVDELQLKVNELGSRLDASKASEADKQDKLASLTVLLKATNEKVDSLTASHEEAEAAYQTLLRDSKEEAEAALQTRTLLTAAKEKAEAAYKTLLKASKEEALQASTLLTASKEEVEADLQRAVVTHSDEVAELNSQINSLKKDIQGTGLRHMAEVAGLKGELESLRNQLCGLQNDLHAGKDRELLLESSLEAAKEAAKTQEGETVAKYQTYLTSAWENFTTVQKQNEILSLNVETLNAREAEAEDRHWNEMRDVVAASREELRCLRSSRAEERRLFGERVCHLMETHEAEIYKLLSQREEREEIINSSWAALLDVQLDANARTVEQEELERKNGELNEMLLQKEMDAVWVENLEKQLSASKAACAALEKAKEKTEKQLASVKAAFAEE